MNVVCYTTLTHVVNKQLNKFETFSNKCCFGMAPQNVQQKICLKCGITVHLISITRVHV